MSRQLPHPRYDVPVGVTDLVLADALRSNLERAVEAIVVSAVMLHLVGGRPRVAAGGASAVGLACRSGLPTCR